MQRRNLKKITGIMALAAILVSTGIPASKPAKSAQVSLVQGGSFETSLDGYWQVWSAPEANRTYSFFRSQDAAYGHGSYSAAIEAAGSPADMFTAGMVANGQNNSVALTAGNSYYLTFYAKSSVDTRLMAYLERADNYSAVTEFAEVAVGREWQKYVLKMTSNYSGQSLAAFVYGSLPDGAVLNFDGIYLFPDNLALMTKTVEGFIGDSKEIKIENIGNFEQADVRVEVPYYDNLRAETGRKSFSPQKMTDRSLTFVFPEGSYAGVGRVYVDQMPVGEFNYKVKPRIDEFSPDRVRADEDLTVYGSGFVPEENNSFMILKKKGVDNVMADHWASPHAIDSKLKQATYRLPVGIARGSLQVSTSFVDIDGVEVKMVSNRLNYEVKPVIYAIEWESRGFNQVGDRIVITGKGISDNPSVIFYDQEGNAVDSKKAAVLEISDKEVIAAESTSKSSVFNVTVKSGNVESDIADSLGFSANPKLLSIKSSNSRKVYSSSETIPAAKTGEAIILNGLALTSAETIYADFQGYDGRLRVPVESTDINQRDGSLTVTVPNGAQNGYVNVIVNGLESNYLPLEIIPTITGFTPDPIVPGDDLVIRAQGVGENTELITVYFIEGKIRTEVKPTESYVTADATEIRLRAPMAVSNNSTIVSVKYDKWADDGTYQVSLAPVITGVSMNTDTKMLVIRGYGFSINPRENVITYKYADEARTVITPDAKVLGVYPTEEGQEIRIQIKDNYHYGYVSVSVGGQISNEMNFGPVSVSKIARRIEFVRSENRVMGVLYISGYNFGPEGGVMVGNTWADIHYRSEYFIIAVVETAKVYDNPVIVARTR